MLENSVQKGRKLRYILQMLQLTAQRFLMHHHIILSLNNRMSFDILWLEEKHDCSNSLAILVKVFLKLRLIIRTLYQTLNYLARGHHLFSDRCFLNSSL